MSAIALDKGVVKCFVHARDLLELLETIDVPTDEGLMLAIEEAEGEVKMGRAGPLKEFVMKLSSKIIEVDELVK
jgi:hypothetical protein